MKSTASWTIATALAALFVLLSSAQTGGTPKHKAFLMTRLYTGTDGQTHVKQKKVQLENGRIESEAFEGYAPAEMFEQAMKESQRLFANQATWLLKQFSLFPMLPGTRSDDDSK